MDELEQNKDKRFWTWSKILIFLNVKCFSQKNVFQKFQNFDQQFKTLPPSKAKIPAAPP